MGLLLAAAVMLTFALVFVSAGLGTGWALCGLAIVSVFLIWVSRPEQR